MNAGSNATFESVAGEAIDLEEVEDGGRITLTDGRAIVADSVVLAIGNLPGEYPIRRSLPFYHGPHYVHMPWAPGALEQIPIGASQDQVLIVMGTPSTVATLNGEVFYYISQRAERKVAFMNQQVVDQRVIAIYFDKNRQVQRLANYGLQDGKIFDFISRTTTTSGQELSYLAPLFKLLSFH